MDDTTLVCALADAPLKVPGSRFNLKCDECGRRVMVAPSGQRFLKAHPLARIACLICLGKKDASKLTFAGSAATGDELRNEVLTSIPNDWTKRKLMLRKEWANKTEISRELGLGPRRVLALAKEQGWRYTDGEKKPGQRLPPRLFSVADMRAYQNRKPAINQDGTPAAISAPLTPARRAPDTSGVVAVLDRLFEAQNKAFSSQLSALSEQTAKQLSAVEETAKHRYVTLQAAAQHVGLSRTALERACESGILSSVLDRGRRVVRVRDVEAIDFGKLGYQIRNVSADS